MKRKKTFVVLFAVSAILISFFAVYQAKIKLTYLEYVTLNDEDNTYLSVGDSSTEIIQEFEAPYELFRGIGIKIGTFARDNNSQWNIQIIDPVNQRMVWQKNFNASQVEDNAFFIIEADRTAVLKKGRLYELHIHSWNANDMTAIAFYCSNQSVIADAQMYVNGEVCRGDLCIQIYGGDRDSWWIGFTVFCICVILVICCRIWFLKKIGQKIFADKIFCAVSVAAVVFLLLCTFAISGSFIDENDNLIGGMIIAKGGVLYKDYVTQHTPVVYYLCAAAAMFGAASLQQFRLFYYIVQAAVWGFLYYRHAGCFGKKRMALLPVLNIVLLSVILSPYSYMILADCIQGICMTALVLEFLVYLKDRQIGWGRAIIVSGCIWGSFGSAFISAYALFVIFAAVVIIEIFEWRNDKCSRNAAMKKYFRLITAAAVPFVCGVMYFWHHDALRQAYNQTFRFNIDVYSMYTGGFGSNRFEPFINALKDFFGYILGNIEKIFSAEAGNAVIVQLIILFAVIVVLIRLVMDRRQMTAFLLFAVMACNASRGYGLHGIAAWHIAVLICVLFGEKMTKCDMQVQTLVFGCLLVYMCGGFISSAASNLLYKQRAIEEIEQEVIAVTEDGDGIFIDEWTCCSIYLLYKNRYPVNRNALFLPWYLDWFEGDLIDDLMNKMPKVVIYDEKKITWDIYADYSQAFAGVLKQYYQPYSKDAENGWKYYFWLRNDLLDS